MMKMNNKMIILIYHDFRSMIEDITTRRVKIVEKVSGSKLGKKVNFLAMMLWRWLRKFKEKLWLKFNHWELIR